MTYAGGLCNCCGDCGICCYVWWCLPCAHAENIALINEENCGCCHCYNGYSEYYIRRNISKKLGEPPSDCNDCCSNQFCFPCLVCQDQRALKFDLNNNNRAADTDAL